MVTATTIFLIDPNTICRNAVQQIIERQTSWRVNGQAGDTDSGIKLLADRKPSLVLIDPIFSPLSPLTCIQTIRQSHPATRIAIFSAIKNTIMMQRMIDAGAQAFIFKHTEPRDLVATLRRVLEGEVCIIPPKPHQGVKLEVVSGDYKDFGHIDLLSGREREVFRAIGRGQSTRQIAEQMKLSIKTIESHRAHIKEKLNLENNLALVQAAAQWSDVSDV